MKIQEIDAELKSFFAVKAQNFDEKVMKRFYYLIEQRELLDENPLVFHYTENVTVGGLQLSAKITEDPYRNNDNLVVCPIPLEAEGFWNKLERFNMAIGSHVFFYVSTPNYGTLRYRLKRSRQIPDVETNLHLQIAQDTLEKIHKGKAAFDITEAETLVNSFVLMNSSISNYFYYNG